MVKSILYVASLLVFMMACTSSDKKLKPGDKIYAKAFLDKDLQAIKLYYKAIPVDDPKLNHLNSFVRSVDAVVIDRDQFFDHNTTLVGEYKSTEKFSWRSGREELADFIEVSLNNSLKFKENPGEGIVKIEGGKEVNTHKVLKDKFYIKLDDISLQSNDKLLH